MQNLLIPLIFFSSEILRALLNLSRFRTLQFSSSLALLPFAGCQCLKNTRRIVQTQQSVMADLSSRHAECSTVCVC